jgi:hypothetical protein
VSPRRREDEVSREGEKKRVKNSGPGDGVVLLVHVEALLGVEVVLDDDDAVFSQRLPASPEKRHKVL